MKYKITCLKCKATRDIVIQKTAVGNRIDWLESKNNLHHPIVSGRERLDGQWGFQCSCGNNDLMTKQEKDTISNPASPKPEEIDTIVKKLKPDKPKFYLVKA